MNHTYSSLLARNQANPIPFVQNAAAEAAVAHAVPIAPGSDWHPAAADSTVLHQLAWGSTTAAEEAGGWLQYYYPRLVLPTPPVRFRRASVATEHVIPDALRLYPNPATDDHLTLTYSARPNQPAELRFVALLSGQTRRVALPACETGEQTVPVALGGLPAGTYACQLLVGGVLQSTKRVVVQ